MRAGCVRGPEEAQGTAAIKRVSRRSPEFEANSIFGSLVTLSELLVLPVREGDTFYTVRFRLFFRSSGIMPLPYTLEASDWYAELKAKHRTKPLDACHLACAAVAGIDVFLTSYIKLTKRAVPGTGRIEGLLDAALRQTRILFEDDK